MSAHSTGKLPFSIPRLLCAAAPLRNTLQQSRGGLIGGSHRGPNITVEPRAGEFTIAAVMLPDPAPSPYSAYPPHSPSTPILPTVPDRPAWQGWLLAVTLFTLGVMLYTSHNNYPFQYHPDEKGKVRQIIARDRNFHHPTLMLEVTDRTVKVLRIFGWKRTNQSVAVVGRTVIACFASLAVVCLALLAWRMYGLLAGAVAGLLVLSDSGLFELAHYFKEDPVLIFGFALTALVFRMFEERPSVPRLVWVGVACGVAASGKYVGLMTVFLALPLALGALRSARQIPGLASRLPQTTTRTVLLFLAAFTLATLACNYRVFEHSGALGSGIGREVEMVVEGHHGIKRESAPHLRYVEGLMRSLPGWPLFLIMAFVFTPLLVDRRPSRTWALLLLITGVYLLLISSSIKISYRYGIPVRTFLVYLEILGAMELPRLFAWLAPNMHRARRIGQVAACSALGGLALLGLQVQDNYGLPNAYKGFAQAESHALENLLNQSIPPHAVILQPEHPYLIDPKLGLFAEMEKDVPQRLVTGDDLLASGDLQPLLDAGITHVLTTSLYRRRYSNKDVTGSDEAMQQFGARQQFYRELKQYGRLVWHQDSGRFRYLRPDLELWEIATPTTKAP